ncbi:zf-HC2 domain-containing protein [Paucisalibacillus sp. EB02]|uniref:zf-HC2 domain-containing protein n=1 Tax=Paucisalibacillus sp. EB02 TaxID=1347087 RepID=UPI0005A7874D|nr:zf-HC2 domain-containing protein [Paucisalibacillus sp. EB02]
MKECPIVEDLLPLYHEGLLKPETTEWVEEHLNNCSACNSLASISSEPIMNDADRPVVDHDKMMAKVTSKLTLYQLIFVGISFFLAIRTVIANESFGFILPYFILGLVTFLFYRTYRLVVMIAFLPVFLWFLGTMLYSTFQHTESDYNFFMMVFDAIYGSFLMAGIHFLFAILGAIVGWLFFKFKESGDK